MGNNPSTFNGEKLPVEIISWLDAVNFANAKSIEAGLTPAYTVTSDGVTWDMSANGYRLPTEAEWEYACRAGTTTPFNTEKSPDATEANFYGHYPYEIEENYFDNSVLEARPGEYRQTTVEVGSFLPALDASKDHSSLRISQVLPGVCSRPEKALWGAVLAGAPTDRGSGILSPAQGQDTGQPHTVGKHRLSLSPGLLCPDRGLSGNRWQKPLSEMGTPVQKGKALLYKAGRKH